jgi:hypothetical protein
MNKDSLARLDDLHALPCTMFIDTAVPANTPDTVLTDHPCLEAPRAFIRREWVKLRTLILTGLRLCCALAVRRPIPAGQTTWSLATHR